MNKTKKVFMSMYVNLYVYDFISKKIGIPLTTIQSRRRRLEKEFFEKKEDFFHLEKFGWRLVLRLLCFN